MKGNTGACVHRASRSAATDNWQECTAPGGCAERAAGRDGLLRTCFYRRFSSALGGSASRGAAATHSGVFFFVSFFYIASTCTSNEELTTGESQMLTLVHEVGTKSFLGMARNHFLRVSQSLGKENTCIFFPVL